MSSLKQRAVIAIGAYLGILCTVWFMYWMFPVDDAQVVPVPVEPEHIEPEQIPWKKPTRKITKDELAEVKFCFARMEDPDNPSTDIADYRVTHWWARAEMPPGDFGCPAPLNADFLGRVELIRTTGKVDSGLFFFTKQDGGWVSPWSIDPVDVPAEYR
jgi:hypothetical protein